MRILKLLLLFSVGLVLMKKTTMRDMIFMPSAVRLSKKLLLLAATPQPRQQTKAQ
jgi:hypothetical protein